MAHLEKVARAAEGLFITVAKTFPNFPRKDNGRVSTSLHNSFLTLIEKYESAINLKYVRDRRLKEAIKEIGVIKILIDHSRQLHFLSEAFCFDMDLNLTNLRNDTKKLLKK